MQESNQCGTTYVTCSASDLTINSSFTSAITFQDVINELCSRQSVKFTCTHCGTECFEECKFTPKCPNCGSLMSRV
jgi:lipopolysaccharide biosynthesis regulator YciM